MSRTPFRVVAALPLLLLAGTAGAVTLDEVIEKNATAHGGLDRWQAVESMEITGTQIAFSEDGPYTLLRRRPNQYRLEENVLEADIVTAYDGTTAWWIQPLMSHPWPVRMPHGDARIARRDAEFEPPFWGYRDKGYQVELAGLHDLDGERLYKLEVTIGDWQEEWYLDPDSFLEVARKSPMLDWGQEAEMWTYYDDFRDVDGLVLAHRIEMEYANRDVVREIGAVKLNTPLDPSLFRMPTPEGMEPLLSLAGEWDVKIESRGSPRAPWAESHTTSVIEPLLDGALLEERFTYEEGGAPVSAVRTRSYDRFREVYRLTHTDDRTTHLNVFEGRLEDGRLVATNELSATSREAFDQVFLDRQTLYDVTPDGFRLDWDISLDGGDTWFTTTKYTYTRK